MKFNKIMILLASVLALASCRGNSTTDPSTPGSESTSTSTSTSTSEEPAPYQSWSDAFKDTLDGGERAILRYEQEYTMPVTMAIIDEVVPYFDAPYIDNWELSKTLLSGYPSGAYVWGIGYDYFWASSSLMDEEILDEKILSVLGQINGWSYDEEALEWRYIYNESLTISLYHGFIPSGSGYVLGIIFDMFYEPQAWADYYVNYAYMEEDYSYAVMTDEITEYVPYFEYEFDSINVSISSYSPGYKVWGLAKITGGAEQAATVSAELTAAFEAAIATDTGFVKEGNVYSKTISADKIIHISITTYSDRVALLFDAYVASKGPSSETTQTWSGKFEMYTTQIANYEREYSFATSFNEIANYIPYIYADYTSLAAESSLHSEGRYMWCFCMSSDSESYQDDLYQALVTIYDCFKDDGWTYDFDARVFSKARSATSNITDYIGVNYKNTSSNYEIYIYVDSATSTSEQA